MAIVFERPAPSEYAPHFERYVTLVPDGDVVDVLSRQIEETARLLDGVTDAQAHFRYAPGKWSLKEVAGHLADTERVMAYRALRISRNDQTPLASFDENLFVANATFDARRMADLVEEFRQVRLATVTLFRGMTHDMGVRRGTASGKPISVRALAFIIAGHEQHHVRIVRERYLFGITASQS